MVTGQPTTISALRSKGVVHQRGTLRDTGRTDARGLKSRYEQGNWPLAERQRSNPPGSPDTVDAALIAIVDTWADEATQA